MEIVCKVQVGCSLTFLSEGSLLLCSVKAREGAHLCLCPHSQSPSLPALHTR